MKTGGAIQVGSDAWCHLIALGAASLGITITTDQIRKFARHAELLLTWNRKINLTAITDPAQIAIKHYLDTLAALTHIPEDEELLDIGTGGGFPGIPLKIMRPAQPMTLIDSQRKKITFVKEAVRTLSLDSIQALHVRAEALAQHDSYRHRYGVIICRALSDLASIVRLSSPLLALEGRIIALKGPQHSFSPSTQAMPKNQLEDMRFKSERFDYRLPVSGDSRALIVITCK